MEEKEVKNCWDFHNCLEEKRKKCRVYKFDSGDECWLVYPRFKGKNDEHAPRDCFKCSWFKKQNPDINEKNLTEEIKKRLRRG